MSITLYKASVPIFIQFLNGLSGVLDKGAAFAEVRKIDPAVVAGLRVYPDMHPLSWQVRSVTNHAVRACALLAGVTQPDLGDTDTTIPELKARIAKAIDFIKTIKPDQINGQEDKEIVLNFGPREFRFTGLSFLLNFCLPNFYFHAATSYDLLRQIGVDVGKRDFMGTPVEL